MTASDGTPMDPTVSSPAELGVDVGPEVDELLRLATSEPRAEELADTRGLASLLEIGGRAPGTLADAATASDPTESVAAAIADVPVAGSEVGDGDTDELSVRRRRRAGRAVKVVAVAAAIAATAGGVAAAATGHLPVPVLGDKAPVEQPTVEGTNPATPNRRSDGRPRTKSWIPGLESAPGSTVVAPGVDAGVPAIPGSADLSTDGTSMGDGETVGNADPAGRPDRGPGGGSTGGGNAGGNKGGSTHGGQGNASGQGNSGAQGNAGGNAGGQGNSGTQGNSGNAGGQGNSGAQGNSGGQGSAGGQGNSGAQGNSGNAGGQG